MRSTWKGHRFRIFKSEISIRWQELVTSRDAVQFRFWWIRALDGRFGYRWPFSVSLLSGMFATQATDKQTDLPPPLRPQVSQKIVSDGRGWISPISSTGKHLNPTIRSGKSPVRRCRTIYQENLDSTWFDLSVRLGDCLPKHHQPQSTKNLINSRDLLRPNTNGRASWTLEVDLVGMVWLAALE